MKKVIKYILIFSIMSISIFSADLKSISFNDGLVSFEMKGIKETDCLINYDDDTRLLFLEIQNSKLALNRDKVDKFISNMENSGYADSMTVEENDKTLYISLRLKSSVGYKLTFSRDRMILALNYRQVKPLIVIDPGHGGKDPGAVRGNVREKDIVIAVAKYLRDELKDEFDIIMTRDNDTFITLSERPNMGNRKGAKFFVSIHANASVNKAANGVEVYYFSKKSDPYAEKIVKFENSFGEKYGENTNEIAQISGQLAYNKNQEKSIEISRNIVNDIASRLELKNGGTHGANFAVLRGFDGPSILIELGFISNANDVAILLRDDARRAMANEIAKNIRRYFE